MTTTQDIPEGEWLTRFEAVVESLLREVDEIRAAPRLLNDKVDRNFLRTLAVIISVWVSIIVAIIIANLAN